MHFFSTIYQPPTPIFSKISSSKHLHFDQIYFVKKEKQCNYLELSGANQYSKLLKDWLAPQSNFDEDVEDEML